MEYNSYSKFFNALASENRLKILDILREQDRTVSEISEIAAIEQSSVSHHLRCLRNCGFVQRKVDGNQRIYTINSEVVENLFSGVEEHIENHENGIYTCEILKDERGEQ
jgi:DNA-binding transcriptional ArsR family regulator